MSEVSDHVAEALRQSEAHFRLLYEHSHVGYQSLDADGCLVEVNPAWLRLLGYGRGEVVGRWIGDFLAPDQAELLRERFPLFKVRGEIRGVEFDFVRKDGAIVSVTIDGLVTRDAAGAFRHTHCVLHDVTERRKVEAELKALSARHAFMLAAVPDIIMEVDTSKVYTWANPAGLRFFGDDVIGKEASFYFEGEQTTYEAVSPLLSGQNDVIYVESWQRRSDGEKRLLAWSCRATQDQAGNFTGALSSARDITEQRRVEEELRESENRVELAVQAADIGMWDLDLVNDTAWRSLRHDQIFGYEHLQPEWGEKIFMTHVAPEDREQVRESFAEAFAGGRLHFECRIDGADHVRRWISVRGQVQRDALGNPVRMLGTIMDITERKRAESEVLLIESLALALSGAADFHSGLRVVLEDVCEATGWVLGEAWVAAPGSAVLTCAATWNTGAKSLDEFSAASTRLTFAQGTGLVGRVWQSKQPVWIRDVMTDASFTRSAMAFEAGLRGAAGVPVIAGGEVVAMLAFFVSETRERDEHFVSLLMTMASQLGTLFQRKQADERHQQQAALLDAATDAILVRSLDGVVKYWNASAERIYGWTEAEALGQNVLVLVNTDAAAFEAAQAELLARGHWSGELAQTDKLGNALVMFCRWTLLFDERGEPMEVLAINTDITEQKELQAQFLRAQRMDSVGALAGGVAHDLNNVLSPILMAAELLRLTTRDEESLAMLATVGDCAKRGAGIISQLLTFARGQQGARTLVPVPQILSEMEKLARELFPRSIETRVTVGDDLWPIAGDGTQVHQALMNLCVNARDAMPDGGVLTLAADNRTLSGAFARRVSDARPGDYVRVSVTDTGAGIPAEVQDRIFDPFFTTKGIGKGTGLGLATTLGIMRGHGGFVRLDSEVGSGTTFELYFPASVDASADTPVADGLPPRRGESELIVVVDDEPSIRSLVQTVLEENGYRVVTAAEGAAALELVASHKTEVRAVITDMMMPGMDGASLVHALERLEPTLPILGMSGLAEERGSAESKSPSLRAVLAKPFSIAKLLAALGEVLDGTASAGGPEDTAAAP